MIPAGSVADSRPPATLGKLMMVLPVQRSRLLVMDEGAKYGVSLWGQLLRRTDRCLSRT